MVSRLERQLVAALTALAMLALGVTSGLGYTYCLSMERAMASCCCPRADVDDDVPVLRVACCEERHVGELPSAVLDAGASIVAPSAIALAPEPPRLALAPSTRAPLRIARDERLDHHRLRPPRAGPSQRLHRTISVFLL